VALCKFIDKNLATGFIRPSCSSHGAPVLSSRRKIGSFDFASIFRGLNWSPMGGARRTDDPVARFLSMNLHRATIPPGQGVNGAEGGEVPLSSVILRS